MVDEIAEECQGFGSDSDACDRDVLVGPEGAGRSAGAEALHRPGESVFPDYAWIDLWGAAL